MYLVDTEVGEENFLHVFFVGVVSFFKLIGYVAGAVVPLIDAICAHPDIEWVLMRNELNASITAAAYAKLRGLDGLACCLGTSGPGASHLTTGIIEAVQDRVPMLCITGLKKNCQLGYTDFQDINQTEIFRAAGCVMSHSVSHPDQMIPLMRDTVATALTQSTAVHLAIPVDIQQSHIHAPRKALCSRGAGKRVHNHLPCEAELSELARLFAQRMRDPAHEMIVAIGRRGFDAAGDILRLARLLHAPIVTMLDAKGAVPETDPLCVGCVSVFGNPGLEIPARLIERCRTVVSFGVDNHLTLLVGTDGLQLRQHIEFDYDSSLIETRFQARGGERGARERDREREKVGEGAREREQRLGGHAAPRAARRAVRVRAVRVRVGVARHQRAAIALRRIVEPEAVIEAVTDAVTEAVIEAVIDARPQRIHRRVPRKESAWSISADMWGASGTRVSVRPSSGARPLRSRAGPPPPPPLP